MSCVPKKLVPILLYHRFGDIGRPSRTFLDPSLFEKQLRRIRDYGYNVVDLDEIIGAVRTGGAPPLQTVSITIDDGWWDNYEIGFPIIRSLGFPVTIFLVSGRIGLDGYIGWREIREMREGGVRFQAHTVSHPRLTEIPAGDARREIADCKKALEDGLGEEVTSFCYPYGFFNRRVRDLVEEAGYRGACCNAPGRAWPDGDVFALKRVTMTYRMARPLLMRAALSGYYVFIKETRAGNKSYIMEKSEISNSKS